MIKKLFLISLPLLLIIFLYGTVASKNSKQSFQDDKSTETREINNVMPYPTPYNAALQDLKFEFSIDKKTDSAFLVILNGDNKQIKKISLGPLDAGINSRVFDRMEFAGIDSGTYRYCIEYADSGATIRSDYRVFYLLR
jgi:hypothetical protein